MKKRFAKFTVTGTYGCSPKGEDDVYTIQEFLDLVKCGAFVDYDGYGNPVLPSKEILDDIDVYPSDTSVIPAEATHVIWYNR